MVDSSPRSTPPITLQPTFNVSVVDSNNAFTDSIDIAFDARGSPTTANGELARNMSEIEDMWDDNSSKMEPGVGQASNYRDMSLEPTVQERN